MHGLDERRRRVARVRNGALLLGSRCAEALLEALGDDEDVVYVLNECSSAVERFEVRTDRRDIVVRKLPLLRCRVTTRALLGAVARGVHGATRNGPGRVNAGGPPSMIGTRDPAGESQHDAARRPETKRRKRRKRASR